MTISALPTPPSRSMAASAFVTAANEFIAALPQFRTEANALLTTATDATTDASDAAIAATIAAVTAAAAATGAMAATTLVASSTTARSAQAAVKTFTLVETGRTFQAGGGDLITAIRRGDSSVRMRGVSSGYAANVLTVDFTDVPQGATVTTYSDWLLLLSAIENPDPSEAIGVATAVAYSARLI